jgi:hypothetical protein
MKTQPSSAKPLSYESWSKYLAGFTLFAVLVGAPLYSIVPESYRTPQSGLGLFLGIVSLALIIFSALYSLRRAKLWKEWGRMEIWLSLHTYLGILALLFAFLHANWQFRAGTATASIVLLILVTLSGAIGWAIYLILPYRISRKGIITTPEEAYFKIERLYERVDKLLDKAQSQDRELTQEEDTERQRAQEEITSLEKELKDALKQESMINGWLYIHIPLSAALIVTVCVHAFMMFYL